MYDIKEKTLHGVPEFKKVISNDKIDLLPYIELTVIFLY